MYRMILHNTLDIPSIKSCLLHPIMMRLIGIDVDECPKFLSPKPSEENHFIYFMEENLRIPLLKDGIISFIPCQKPSEDEVGDEGIIKLDLTPKYDDWDPHSKLFQEQKEAMVNYKGQEKERKDRSFIISSVVSRSIEPELFC